MRQAFFEVSVAGHEGRSVYGEVSEEDSKHRVNGLCERCEQRRKMTNDGVRCYFIGRRQEAGN